MINNIINDLSLIFLDDDGFENHINKILRVLGTYLDVSRSYLFLDNKDGNYTTNTNEWVATGIQPTKEISQNVPYIDIDFLKKSFEEKTFFYCENINSLESKARDYLQKQNIKSLLVFPIFIYRKKVGFVGIDECTRIRAWTKEEENILKLIASVISREYHKKRLENKVKFLENNDKLTKLYNRNYFFERKDFFEKEFLDKKCFTIILLDIDYFKEINTLHGHDAGDFVLQEFGETLKKIIRTDDFLARYDGNEFIIVTKTCEKENILALIKRIKSKMKSKVFIFNEKEIKITFTVGTACSGELKKDNFSLSSLVSLVDERLEKEKSKRKT